MEEKDSQALLLGSQEVAVTSGLMSLALADAGVKLTDGQAKQMSEFFAKLSDEPPVRDLLNGAPAAARAIGAEIGIDDSSLRHAQTISPHTQPSVVIGGSKSEQPGGDPSALSFNNRSALTGGLLGMALADAGVVLTDEQVQRMNQSLERSANDPRVRKILEDATTQDREQQASRTSMDDAVEKYRSGYTPKDTPAATIETPSLPIHRPGNTRGGGK